MWFLKIDCFGVLFPLSSPQYLYGNFFTGKKISGMTKSKCSFCRSWLVGLTCTVCFCKGIPMNFLFSGVNVFSGTRKSCGCKSWEYQWNGGTFPLPTETLSQVSLWQFLYIWCISLISEVSLHWNSLLIFTFVLITNIRGTKGIRSSNFHLCIYMH